MRKKFTILIADRNRNIRQFLKRELEAEGYLINLANNGLEVLEIVTAEPPDLLILDLDMTYLNGVEILNQFERMKWSVPVVVYTLLTIYEDHPVIQKTAAAFLEKNENNIDSLKEKIVELLYKNYPHKIDKGIKRMGTFPPSRSL